MRALIAIALLSFGCSSKSKGWEQSRARYCDAVDLLRSEVAGAVETWSKRFTELSSTPADRQVEGCLDAKSNLDILYGRVWGFTEGAGALAYGRGDASMDQAGLALKFGAEPIMLLRSDIHCVTSADWPATAKRVGDGGTQAVKQLDDALASCRAVGWKSALKPTTP